MDPALKRRRKAANASLEWRGRTFLPDPKDAGEWRTGPEKDVGAHWGLRRASTTGADAWIGWLATSGGRHITIAGMGPSPADALDAAWEAARVMLNQIMAQLMAVTPPPGDLGGGA